ncbi:MAG TPA: YceI family protein [Candidatus Acidoferrales bacterium]|nr:YceI family protein [Candidatus Acidoferrales bacterium]
MGTAAQAGTGTATWKMDTAHSHAQFKVRHMMISNVKGEFAGINGALELNDADYTKSKVQASIDAASINTREPQRDTHLKSADFLDVEKFPALTFASTKISKKTEDEYSVAGDLTIHGVTRPVVFSVESVTAPAKDPWGNTRIGLEATAKINRKDFGLVWNAALETGGVLVGDEVHITVDAEFVKG